MTTKSILLISLVFSTILSAYTLSDGAPFQACSTLKPQHGVPPQPCEYFGSAGEGDGNSTVGNCPFTLRLVLAAVDSSPVDQMQMATRYRCNRQHTCKLHGVLLRVNLCAW